MKISKNLVTGLFGLALLAAPVAAAAKDNDHGGNDSHQAQAQSHGEQHHAEQGGDHGNHNEGHEQHQARSENHGGGAPAMERHEVRDNNNVVRDNRPEQHNARVETRNNAPEVRQESRGQHEARGYTGPAVAEHRAVTEHREVREANRENNRDWREDRHEGDHDRDHDRDRWNHEGHERWIYGDRGRDYDLAFDPDYDREYASGWVMPYQYSGGACSWARHLRAVYRHDRYTGHPAAAASLLGQLHHAERVCGGSRYGYNSYRYGYPY